MSRLKVLSALALGWLAVCGSSYGQSSDSPPATTAPLDIAGVQLGMNPEQVRAVLKTRKFPTHEFMATLSYVGSATGQSVEIPNSTFLNAIVQSAVPTRRTSADNLTVFFSPIPGHEQVVAIAHYNNYPRGREIRELDLKTGLAEKYGELPTTPASPRDGFQFSRVWSFPTRESGTGQHCHFNLTERFAAAGWWNSIGLVPKNYVIGNRDLLLELVKKNCGPSIVEVDWSTRDSKLPPEQRLLEQNTVSIVSLQLARESILAATKIIMEMQDSDDQVAMRSANAEHKPES